MRKIITPILTLLLVLTLSTAFASNAPENSSAKIENLQVDVSPQYLTIDFEIPYPGLVDFTLLHKDGKRIWKNYYVKEKGSNQIRVKVHTLPGGEQFGFNMAYKGNDISHNFEIPLIQ